MELKTSNKKDIIFELYDVRSYTPEQLPTLFPQLVPAGWIELFADYTRELEDVGKVLKRLVETQQIRSHRTGGEDVSLHHERSHQTHGQRQRHQ